MAARAGARRVRVLVGSLALMLAAPGVGCERTTADDQALEPKQEFTDCQEVCPEMVVVPAGEFTMGSNDFDREKPPHKVTIGKPFAVGKFEVTFAEWDACVAATGCKQKPGDEGWGRGKRPVIYVSWNDAKEYAAWLSKKTGKSYRLLSEAEWEYAARAGTTTKYSFGETTSPWFTYLWRHAW
jgi:formylglycine-generating enzyme required for sulfatase activity